MRPVHSVLTQAWSGPEAGPGPGAESYIRLTLVSRVTHSHLRDHKTETVVECTKGCGWGLRWLSQHCLSCGVCMDEQGLTWKTPGL